MTTRNGVKRVAEASKTRAMKMQPKARARKAKPMMLLTKAIGVKESSRLSGKLLRNSLSIYWPRIMEVTICKSSIEILRHTR